MLYGWHWNLIRSLTLDLCIYHWSEQRLHFGVTCLFDDLQTEILIRRRTGLVSISSDFNARTAQMRDTYRDTTLLRNGCLSETRFNKDLSINMYGKKLIELCKINDFVILNGRSQYGKCGQNNDYTCYRYKGISVVDYAITNLESLNILTNFQVLEKLIESDHAPLSFTFNVILDKKCTLRNGEHGTAYRYKWNQNRKDIFLETLCSPAVQTIYEYILCEIADQRVKSEDIVNSFYDVMLMGIGQISGKWAMELAKTFLGISGLTKTVSV